MGMGKILVRWSISGAVVGALAFAHYLFLLSAIVNKADVRHWWLILGVVLCPTVATPLRNIGLILVLNCTVYALVFVGFRLGWFGLFGQHQNSN